MKAMYESVKESSQQNQNKHASNTLTMSVYDTERLTQKTYY
jgi:hypothetical protein